VVAVEMESMGSATVLDAMVERSPSGCSPEDEQNLSLALSVLIEFLVIRGFQNPGYDGSSTLQHWQLCSASCGWMKFLKYKFSAFFSYHLRGELPKAPFDVPDHPGHVIGGSAGRFLSLQLRGMRPGSPRKNFITALELCVGVLYLKKGMPRASEADLAAACLKTSKVLTETQRLPTCDIPYLDRTVQFPDILKQIQRTCVEIVRTAPPGMVSEFGPSVLHRPYAPSIKANVVDNRMNFGTLGTLFREGFIVEPEAYDDRLTEFFTRPRMSNDDEEFFNMSLSLERDLDEFGREIVDPRRGRAEYRDAVKISEPVGANEHDEVRESSDEVRPLVVEPDWKLRFQHYYTDLYERVRKASRNGRFSKFKVRLVALAESLKIRVISKGPPLKYWLLKPIQKFLSKLLGTHPCFKLTRQTITASFLSEFFGGEVCDCPESGCSCLFHSLDYEGATDNLNPDCSAEAVSALNKELNMPEDLGKDFLDALIHHTIDGRPQLWGQLMGSPVSFPILCLVNLAMIRFSYELSVGKKVSILNCPALVNGDDGLVRAPSSFLGIWKQIAALAGLKPSLGKVYSHPLYANMNSTSYLWDPDTQSFSHIPFVNMGLALGYQRSSADHDISDVFDVDVSVDERVCSVGARHRELIRSCPAHDRLRVHLLFLKKNRDLLNLLGNIPWYVPEEYGGVGLEIITDPLWDGDLDTYKQHILFGPTELESRVVDSLRDDLVVNRCRRLPVETALLARSTWSSLIPFSNRRGTFSMTEEDSGFLDTTTYFAVPSLIMRGASVQRLKVLRANQRFWRRMRRSFNRIPVSAELFRPPTFPELKELSGP